MSRPIRQRVRLEQKLAIIRSQYRPGNTKVTVQFMNIFHHLRPGEIMHIGFILLTALTALAVLLGQ